MNSSNIIICGDIHGSWAYINALINKKQPEIILQCGDWGWFPHFHNKPGFYTDSYGNVTSKKWDQFGVKPQNTKIYWCSGNHDNHDDLDKYNSITELEPNIFYCPFGTVLTLPTGEKVLMVGKALSIDKESRVEGIDWWKNEVITQYDMDNLPDTNIDIVISHTVPRLFLNSVNWTVENSANFNDSSTMALQIILKQYKPKCWYSGHYHRYFEANLNGCHWVSLDMCGNQNVWWKYYKEY